MNVTTTLWRFPALLERYEYAPLVRHGNHSEILEGLKALIPEKKEKDQETEEKKDA